MAKKAPRIGQIVRWNDDHREPLMRVGAINDGTAVLVMVDERFPSIWGEIVILPIDDLEYPVARGVIEHKV